MRSDEPMHTAWPIVLLLLFGPSGDRPAVSETVRVRAAASATGLLAEAAGRSAIIRDLIARLEATDVIVYVEMTPSPQIPTARTRLVTATVSARFLRIGLSTSLTPFDLAPLLAHELQHAVEIAERADVRDDAGVRLLYARIGRLHGIDRYETDAAGEVERQVRAEVRRKLPAP
jgi:hypothetical protein